MKQTALIVLILVLAAIVLVGLNLASYTQKPKEADLESSPNRSSYNGGGTGTLAFYSLLSESGRKVTRWQNDPSYLRTAGARTPKVFIVIGDLRRQFTETEAGDLFAWVESGGRLVIIDRQLAPELERKFGDWTVEFEPTTQLDIINKDPTDTNSMIASVGAIKPVFPSLFSAEVNAIQPSRFASVISFTKNDKDIRTGRKDIDGPADTSSAPVVHYSNSGKAIVAHVAYGSGRVVYVGDPFIVSNSGISLADNAQFAINLSRTDGLIAFDEYHQGFGASSNRFAAFFSGTPVVAVFFQLAALVGLVLFSRSRRFARPLSEIEPDRRTKLEYISAMAELQQRVNAYDLAIENIFRDFRLRTCRALGLDPSTTSTVDLARAIAGRTGDQFESIYETLDKCEQIMFGSAVTKGQFVELVQKLRGIDIRLGTVRQLPKK
ncbi:MAG TPA: DUF4350 domain-containing protein [Pyrinomonadaceae bacterium]|nr:DUF4350 domain-containing protein [Pyrinomonadaceae bacterium]